MTRAMSEPSTLSRIEACLARCRTGDGEARAELITHASERLRALTARMLAHSYSRLARWEDADDVFQNAALRLCRALAEVTPATPRDFLRLAALQIRRELLDLARHYFGPQGPGAHHHSVAPGSSGATPPGEAPQSTYDPSRLAEWTDFHAAAEALPDDQREVVDLLWYQGLSQDEAATLLAVDVRTVQRRWLRARLKLHARLRDEKRDDPLM